MKFKETIAQQTEQSIRYPIQNTTYGLKVMSTTARYPIKPKTLSLLELCQSISDFRHAPPSLTSFQYQPSPSTSQILTRRLYLHPLTVNPNVKPQVPKFSYNNSTTSPDSEQRHQTNLDKNREINQTKKKSSHKGLAILSSSFPLIARINPKPDTRHSRDKTSLRIDDDTNSDLDISITTNSCHQSSLSSITRGTLASTHTLCTRPYCVGNHQKIYTRPTHLKKMNVWNHIDRTLERPIPTDPPTTPLGSIADLDIENEELDYQDFNYNSIQEIKIFKRNPRPKSFLNKDNDYDDYLYNEE